MCYMEFLCRFKLKKIDLKKVTRKFVSQCVQCLDSAAMKTQAVQVR